MELLKLLISPHPDVLRKAYEAKLTEIFFPEFDRMMETTQNNPHHSYTVGEHTLRGVKNIEPNPILRMTLLLHDIAKPVTKTTDENGIDHFHRHPKVGYEMAKDILRRLKFDNRSIYLITTLILYHDTRFYDPAGKGRAHVRRMINKVGEQLFPYLLKVMEADVKAQGTYMLEKKLTLLAETAVVYDEIIKAGNCLSLKDLKINGRQLMALGFKEGETLGKTLDTLLAMVLEHPELNEYIYLKELALKLGNCAGE
jgi:tRNA nucleotidyltransferase (CCA-adding enzyme)